MTTTNTTSETGPNVLASLRGVCPTRPMRFYEALQVAELQANRLLELSGIDDGAVPSTVIGELPHIRIEQRDLPTSGMSYWTGSTWVICLNEAEPRTRQRFTLFHEFKHILDHSRTRNLYRGTGRTCSEAQAEQAADYFAGCALMSKRILRRAWADRSQESSALARLLDVSPRAIEVRLAQLGLTEPRVRCLPPTSLRYADPPAQQSLMTAITTRRPIGAA